MAQSEEEACPMSLQGCYILSLLFAFLVASVLECVPRKFILVVSELSVVWRRI